MSQFAISPAVPSPAEAELASMLPDPVIDGFLPLGFFLVAVGYEFTVVVIGMSAALDADGWWVS